MNKVGEMRSYSAGDKLPESTGDKLQNLLGGIFNLPGETFQTVMGDGFTGVSVFRRGTNLIFLSRNIKTAGDAC